MACYTYSCCTPRFICRELIVPATIPSAGAHLIWSLSSRMLSMCTLMVSDRSTAALPAFGSCMDERRHLGQASSSTKRSILLALGWSTAFNEGLTSSAEGVAPRSEWHGLRRSL